jgi:hypothetical protein
LFLAAEDENFYMLFLKRIGLVIAYFSLIFLVFFLIDLCDSLEDFEIYHCEEGGFSVLLPGEPEQVTDELSFFFDTFGFTTLSAGSKKSQFAVTYFDLSEGIKRKHGFYKSAETSPLDYMKMFTQAITGGRLVKETDSDFHGHPAKDFELEILSRVGVKARAISIGERCYQLMVKSHSPDVLDKKAFEFFNSFKVDDENNF